MPYRVPPTGMEWNGWGIRGGRSMGGKTGVEPKVGVRVGRGGADAPRGGKVGCLRGALWDRSI